MLPNFRKLKNCPSTVLPRVIVVIATPGGRAAFLSNPLYVWKGACLAQLILQDADVRLHRARDRAQQLHALLAVLHLRPHLHGAPMPPSCQASFPQEPGSPTRGQASCSCLAACE